MALQSLGYIGVQSTRLEDWGHFATGLLGMQRVDAAGGVQAYRMDDRKQRLVVSAADGDGIGFLGWEVADAAAMEALAARLEAADTPVRQGSRALATQRHVSGLICFADPAGTPLEVYSTGPRNRIRPLQARAPDQRLRHRSHGYGARGAQRGGCGAVIAVLP